MRMPRRARREAADDGDRRGDDQGAGASDYQQHQRLVDPGQPRPAQDQRGSQRHSERQREDSRRVDGRKAVDKALGGSALRLCSFDGMNDPRQDSVAGRLGHLELQRPALVDRPGEYVVAWRLVDGDAFACHRGLVNGALSFGHPAIERETFTGFDPRDGAYGHGLGFDGGPGTVDLAHLDLWRRQLQQTSDRVSRALDRPGLDKFGQRIERHDHRRLGPLANGKGARNGHTHQGVDVELAPKQRGQAFAEH